MQLGKLLGHSELFGNPLGLITSVGTGVAGFMRGVGHGIARGDGDEIARSGKGWLLLATYCLLPTTYCLLPTTYCLLPSVY